MVEGMQEIYIEKYISNNSAFSIFKVSKASTMFR